MEEMIIRREESQDARQVETLVREAFWNVYRPGAMEHFVLHRLRAEAAFVRELNYVMVCGGEIVGQNVFVRAEVALDDGRRLPVLAMGPLCIAPARQRQGLGKRLLDFTLARAAELGHGAVCFEGNIAFYGKSGLRPASTFGLRTTVYRPGPTPPSSWPRRSGPAISTAYRASTPHPLPTLSASASRRLSRPSRPPFRRAKSSACPDK